MGAAKQPVLILGVEPRISVPIARSLHQQGIPVAIGGLSPQDPRISSRAVMHFLRLPGYQDQAAEFLEALSSFIRTKGVDMLIPATDAALSAISQHYDALSPLLHVACPPPHIAIATRCVCLCFVCSTNRARGDHQKRPRLHRS